MVSGNSDSPPPPSRAFDDLLLGPTLEPPEVEVKPLLWSLVELTREMGLGWTLKSLGKIQLTQIDDIGELKLMEFSHIYDAHQKLQFPPIM